MIPNLNNTKSNTKNFQTNTMLTQRLHKPIHTRATNTRHTHISQRGSRKIVCNVRGLMTPKLQQHQFQHQDLSNQHHVNTKTLHTYTHKGNHHHTHTTKGVLKNNGMQRLGGGVPNHNNTKSNIKNFPTNTMSTPNHNKHTHKGNQHQAQTHISQRGIENKN